MALCLANVVARLNAIGVSARAVLLITRVALRHVAAAIGDALRATARSVAIGRAAPHLGARASGDESGALKALSEAGAAIDAIKAAITVEVRSVVAHVRAARVHQQILDGGVFRRVEVLRGSARDDSEENEKEFGHIVLFC